MEIITETFFNTQETKRFYFPGRIFWGEGCASLVADLLESVASVEIFTDGFFADHPWLHSIREKLGPRLRSQFLVKTMPVAEQVTAFAYDRKTMPGAVLALGGGSTIDAAKASIAVSLYGTLNGVGMGEKRGLPPREDIQKPLFVAIPTTAGTGAEASRYYVTYGADGRAKQHGKSWKLVADWIFLDPAFARHMPERIRIECAFDAFIHFLESYLCKCESSWTNNMLSLDGICRLMAALDSIARGKDESPQTMLALQHAACMAGVAISNVRTGHLHEAAGALLEHTALSHPQTLHVFFRDGIELIAAQAADKLDSIARFLSAMAPQLGIGSFADIIAWWDVMLAQAGSTAAARRALHAVSAERSAVLQEHIILRVIQDKVWAEKECPRRLDRKNVGSFVNNALARFGILADHA